LLSAALHRAEDVLRANRAVLEQGAHALLLHETLDEAALQGLQAQLVKG
jgi:uncharacterized protein (DUF1778 family)